MRWIGGRLLRLFEWFLDIQGFHAALAALGIGVTVGDLVVNFVYALRSLPEILFWPSVLVLSLLFGWLVAHLFKTLFVRPIPSPPLSPLNETEAEASGEKATAQVATATGEGSTIIQAGTYYGTPPVNEFANAPHLIWSEPRAENLGDGYELIVACDGVSALAVVIKDLSWVESAVNLLGDPLPADGAPTTAKWVREEMGFYSFGAPIQPGGRFHLRMQCREDDPHPGERDVKWRVVYKDDDMANGFITECWARVSFVGPGHKPKVIDHRLDNTSRKTRNDDYNNFMRDRKDASSTGDRRPHPPTRGAQ